MTADLLAAAPSAEVTATDLNEAMVAFWSTRAPGAVWRQADAQRLPFPDGGFDLVVCEFGVMLFPDRIEAFTEIHRVLDPGGQFLFNTWGPLGTHALEVVVFPGLRTAFSLVRYRAGGLVAVVTCRVVALVEVEDAVGRGTAGTA
ncbi:class I SAM-dependent methyltransferase [Streptomyces sp. NPDC088760]|uniref:class I SAM-dependent methyltransferase n=1 Tax=Streptomyces sp. NPDC088760 TaxID=3365890 RepID=UPI00381C050D